MKHVDFIKAFLENEKDYTLTLRDLEEKLLLKFPDLENISRVTLGRLLKQLGYSYKKINGYPEKRNDPDIKLVRFKLIQKLAYSLFQNFNIIFIDETSVHLGI